MDVRKDHVVELRRHGEIEELVRTRAVFVVYLAQRIAERDVIRERVEGDLVVNDVFKNESTDAGDACFTFTSKMAWMCR